MLAKILSWFRSEPIVLRLEQPRPEDRPILTGIVKCLGCGKEYALLDYLPGSSVSASMVCSDSLCRMPMELFPDPHYGWGLPKVLPRERPN